MRAHESEDSINKKNYSKKNDDMTNELNLNNNKEYIEENDKKIKNKEIINEIKLNKLNYFCCFICCKKKN